MIMRCGMSYHVCLFFPIYFEFQWNETKNVHTQTRYIYSFEPNTHTHINFPHINNESILPYIVVVDAVDSNKKAK